MARFFEFEVTLVGTKPRIWRRFLLRRQHTSFINLHGAIQEACGWTESHMWHFTGPKRPYPVIASMPSHPNDGADLDHNIDLWTGERYPQAHMVSLQSYFKQPRDTALYTYDFGDDWEHKVVLKKIVEHKEPWFQRLTAGALAFPPEDCGGLYGYYACAFAVDPEFLPPEAADEFDADDIAERREWLEESEWRPRRFDLEKEAQRFNCNMDEITWGPVHPPRLEE